MGKIVKLIPSATPSSGGDDVSGTKEKQLKIKTKEELSNGFTDRIVTNAIDKVDLIYNMIENNYVNQKIYNDYLSQFENKDAYSFIDFCLILGSATDQDIQLRLSYFAAVLYEFLGRKEAMEDPNTPHDPREFIKH